ncbi:cytosolic 5'-nucleotidase 1A-like [Mugil cephalus]|uniref:cytosolic 5'-nucleotidase 1A-like n=1 Tax=Mugil cephalus TaxID=48193 RepID=UPI001FB80ABA|nr:cytosolic 5'-nucleotidase 1A-like [Mugil cephalus]
MSNKNKVQSWKRSRETNTSMGENTTKKFKAEFAVNIAMTTEVFSKMEPQDRTAFSFIKALEAVNAKLREHYPDSEELFKVILIHDNSADAPMDTIREQGLEELITIVPVKEKNLVDELQKNDTHLYLCTEPGWKAQEAANKGIATGIVSIPENMRMQKDQLRFAFDGDAVLFSNESELVFQRDGLEGYLKNETKNVEVPMGPGPFKRFLEVLVRLQRKLYDKGMYKDCPMRTYLVTARDPGFAGYRILNTLRLWGVEIGEAVFLGGTNKGPTLEKISPHIFFDDQQRHVDAALAVGTVSGKALYHSQ